MLKAAVFYASKGYSVIATGDTKRAILQWKKFQSEIPDEKELQKQFTHAQARGLAVICGAVSGNLEVVDVDVKYDLTGTLWEDLSEMIKPLLDKLYIVKTKSAGYHLYYKCEVIEQNQKLASRPATEEELKNNPNVKEIVLIETRGEGGYVIAPPTPGYEKINEFNVPVLTIGERDFLLSSARSFNQIVEEIREDHKVNTNASFQKTPWDDYNSKCDVVALLEKHGWSFIKKSGPRLLMKRPGITDQYCSGDYHEEKNLFKVFSSSTPFDLNKGYKPFAVYAILEHGGDYSAAAKQLIHDGYGEAGSTGTVAKKVLKSLGGGQTKRQISETLINEDGLSKKDADRIINDVEDNMGPELLTFWEIAWTKTGNKIIIVRHKLVQFLYDNGFHLFFYDKNNYSYRIVQQKDGFVSDVSFQTIKKFIKDYVDSLPAKFDGVTPFELMEVIMKGADTYFGKGLIEFVSEKELDILKDTDRYAYFTFSNGIVRVGENGPVLLTYGEVGKPVWKSQVIDFKVDLDFEFDPMLCEYYDFLHKISCGNQYVEDSNNEYLLSLIGYLLHRYKDPSRPYAVILAEEIEEEKKGGGTGKGIFVKALSYMANLERVDGKNFKLDKNFAFQRVGLDTKIVAIEDVRKNVDFEGFYAIITEGMTIERKNKDEYFIPYKDSPKIIFSTNYTIAGNGGHGKRRQKIFEFTNFFSASHTPMDQYNHKLFDDWDPDEWNRFYNLMFLCVSDYLMKGVRKMENSLKMNRKHVRLNFTPEFMEWWDGWVSDLPADYKAFRDMYTGFLVSNGLEKKEYSQKRFRAAIDESCERFGFSLATSKIGPERLLHLFIEKSAS